MKTSKHVLTILMPPLLLASVAFGSPGAWQGSFVFSGGDTEAQAQQAAIQQLRGSDLEKLPFGATVPQKIDVTLQAPNMTIQPDSTPWIGPYDGSIFSAKSVSGADVRVKRTLVEQGDAPPAVVEIWKALQPRQGRSMVGNLIQQTRYELSTDGTTLTLKVSVEGGRLREPLGYTLTYRRQ